MGRNTPNDPAVIIVLGTLGMILVLPFILNILKLSAFIFTISVIVFFLLQRYILHNILIPEYILLFAFVGGVIIYILTGLGEVAMVDFINDSELLSGLNDLITQKD